MLINHLNYTCLGFDSKNTGEFAAQLLFFKLYNHHKKERLLEFTMRTNTMFGIHENCKLAKERINREYNNIRQQMITQEIAEIINAESALE